MQKALLALDEALTLLAEAVPSPHQSVIRADRDDPAMDRSIMDGVALRAADGMVPRHVLGTLFAGDDPSRFQVEVGTCVRIMTGAALPAGADAVVPVEQLVERDGQLTLEDAPKPMQFISRRGCQAHAGDLLIDAGLPLTAARHGLRAWVGEQPVPLRRIRVGIAATGDELKAEPAPYQIRDSNGPMLAALSHMLGAEVLSLPPVPDEPEAIERFLTTLDGVDVLLTAGGVSMGEKDFLPQVLERLGARILFHRIRIKPGKPTLAAVLDGRVLLCLPGNPASAYVNTLLFLPVILRRMEGRVHSSPWRMGRLVRAVANPGDRPMLHPCRQEGDALTPLPSRGSADLVRLAQADVCAWIPESGLEAGETRYLELV